MFLSPVWQVFSCVSGDFLDKYRDVSLTFSPDKWSWYPNFAYWLVQNTNVVPQPTSQSLENTILGNPVSWCVKEVSHCVAPPHTHLFHFFSLVASIAINSFNFELLPSQLDTAGVATDSRADEEGLHCVRSSQQQSSEVFVSFMGELSVDPVSFWLFFIFQVI